MALAAAGCVNAVIVPPAPAFSRQLTPRIATMQWRRGGWFSATYTDVRKYASPLDAQLFTRMWATPGTPGKWDKHWMGENLIQAFAETETAAIASLLETLDQLQLPYEAELARVLLQALAFATPKTPWEQRAMGVRGPKPRPKTYKWRTADGKRTRIYADTLKPHRDPACQCAGCTMIPTKTKDAPPK